MGALQSCIKTPGKEEKNKEVNDRPCAYEEIDDNFTILPTAAKNNNHNKDPKPNNVTTTTATKKTKSNGIIHTKDGMYENTTTTSTTTSHSNNNTNLRNYETRTTKVNSDVIVEFQNVLYATTKTATSSNQADSDVIDNDASENTYVNCMVTSSSTSQSPQQSTTSNEIQDNNTSSERLANQQPGNGVQVPQKDGGVTDVSNGNKAKQGNKNKPTNSALAARLKKALNYKKATSSSSSSSSSSSTKKDNDKDTITEAEKEDQLTYIELDFDSPGKTPAKAKPVSPPEPATTYTEVVHEGGRLVLIT